MYKIHRKLDKRSNYHSPAEARSYYGRYSRDGITVHWWNSPENVKDSDHDSIVNYIYNKGTSVHYVVSNKKITLMVSPDNVAWHAQKGNPTTIGIEFSPHLNTEGYKRAGWLISELEKRYKKTLKLYKHSDWVSTQCPGHLDLGRMRREANKFKEEDVKTNREQAIWLWRTVRFKHSPTDAEKRAWTGKDLTKLLKAEYATDTFKKRKVAVRNYDKILKQKNSLIIENNNLQTENTNLKKKNGELIIERDGLVAKLAQTPTEPKVVDGFTEADRERQKSIKSLAQQIRDFFRKG